MSRHIAVLLFFLISLSGQSLAVTETGAGCRLPGGLQVGMPLDGNGKPAGSKQPAADSREPEPECD